MTTLIPTMFLVMFLLLPGVGHAETYQYDKAGRLIEVTYDDGSVLRYAYDADGVRRTVKAAPDFVPPEDDTPVDASPETPRADDDKGGCGCASSGAGQGTGLLALLMLGMRRR